MIKCRIRVTFVRSASYLRTVCMSGGLLAFTEKLRDAGELAEIRIPVDPLLEITEIADRMSKLPGGGKALLFHDTGTRFLY
jgi:4-hydroxy-3-polyprenylbenzoate decarboxylase